MRCDKGVTWSWFLKRENKEKYIRKAERRLSHVFFWQLSTTRAIYFHYSGEKADVCTARISNTQQHAPINLNGYIAPQVRGGNMDLFIMLGIIY